MQGKGQPPEAAAWRSVCRGAQRRPAANLGSHQPQSVLAPDFQVRINYPLLKSLNRLILQARL